jgi:hypothetical protein
MRRLALACALLFSVSLTGCLAGPHQLRRTVDDWDNKMYVKSPWVDAVLWIVPVFPILNFGATIGDFFVTDGYTFWIKDAFTGQGGTGFKHYDVQSTKTMKSLLSDDGKFLQATTTGG